jgi:tetratricopeptide (TPR) repeat protein
MAEALASAGLLGEARDQAREAGRLAAQAGAERGQTFAGLALARSLLLDGQFEGARFYLDAAIGHRSPKMRIHAFMLRSELERRAGSSDLARQDARTALSLARPLGAAHLELAALVALLLVPEDAPPDGGPAVHLQRAAELERVTGGLMDTAWQLLLIRARWLRSKGDLQAALQHYQSAVDRIQALRADFAAVGIVEACLDDPEKLLVYREALDTALQAGDEVQHARILADANWPPLETYKDVPAHSGNIAPGGAISNVGT